MVSLAFRFLPPTFASRTQSFKVDFYFFFFLNYASRAFSHCDAAEGDSAIKGLTLEKKEGIQEPPDRCHVSLE